MTKPFNRTSSRLAIGLFAILLASPALGQGPLGFQIFAPADVSTYGGDQQPNEGYFFQFDGLYWSISQPDARYLGLPPPATRLVWYGPNANEQRPQVSTVTTDQGQNLFSVGDRFEFGRVEDRNGWFVSIFQVRNQGQGTVAPSADVVFSDPDLGAGRHLLAGPVVAGGADVLLPVTLYDVSMTHLVDTWGVELMFLHRAMTCHNGGTFELFAGARYLEFNDTFLVSVGDTPSGLTVPGFLDGSSWDTVAENHVVGPEIGVRWSKKQGRWMLSSEGRFLAGVNYQNFHQQVNLGPELNPGKGTLFMPSSYGETTTRSSAYAREWSPGVELRVEARYQITRAISFHAGWTGLWVDGIARGDAVINYAVPGLGIDLTNNRENVFMNGLTLGFDINR